MTALRPLRVLGTLLLASTCATTTVARAQAPLVAPGDRVLLRVEGEPQLTDTFTVVAGPALDLPALGRVGLAGVPRDSVRDHLTAFLGRFLNRPVVQAEVLLRLGLLGDVARPGFYALPAGAVLDDLVMAGGGPGPEARFDRATLRRDQHVVLTPDRIRRAVTDGTTLDALGLRSGDVLQVPRRADQESRVRILSALVALPLSVYAVSRLF